MAQSNDLSDRNAADGELTLPVLKQNFFHSLTGLGPIIHRSTASFNLCVQKCEFVLPSKKEMDLRSIAPEERQMVAQAKAA